MHCESESIVKSAQFVIIIQTQMYSRRLLCMPQPGPSCSHAVTAEWRQKVRYMCRDVFRLFCSRSRWKKARLRCLRCIVPRNSMKMQVQNIFKAQRYRLLLLAVFFHPFFQGSFSASFPYFCFAALDVKFVHSVLRYSHLFFSSRKAEFIHFV